MKDCWHLLGELQINGTWNETRFAMPDEWVMTFLLTELTEEFGSMIMALGNSSDKLTSDEVKSKLLQ